MTELATRDNENHPYQLTEKQQEIVRNLPVPADWKFVNKTYSGFFMFESEDVKGRFQSAAIGATENGEVRSYGETESEYGDHYNVNFMYEGEFEEALKRLSQFMENN